MPFQIRFYFFLSFFSSQVTSLGIQQKTPQQFEKTTVLYFINSRFQHLFDVAQKNLTTHNNRQVDTQLGQTTRLFTWLHVIKNKQIPSLDKGDVKDGRVEVDKLKEIHLHGQRILIVGVELLKFHVRQFDCQPPVKPLQNQNHEKIQNAGCDRDNVNRKVSQGF